MIIYPLLCQSVYAQAQTIEATRKKEKQKNLSEREQAEAEYLQSVRDAESVKIAF